MPAKGEIHVLGAGGHAKVVVSTLLAAGYEVRGILDDDPRVVGGEILGVEISGPISRVSEFKAPRAVIAIGDNRARKKVAQNFPGVEWMTVVHPTAYVHPTVRLGPGTVLFAGSIIQPQAVVGAHCIINTASSIDHDCVLADFVHIAPGVCLAGSVHLAEGAFMGIGSVVIPGVKVGPWSVVAAGAVVVNDLGPNVVAMGTPARVSRVTEPD